MGLFDSFITYLTEGGKKEGFRLWEGKSGSYIKKGGNIWKRLVLFCQAVEPEDHIKLGFGKH